jgi:hypothetical protein
MLAFIGLGTQEILLLLVLGALIVVPVVIVLFVVRTSGRGSRLAHLEDENRRLRAEPDEKRDRR